MAASHWPLRAPPAGKAGFNTLQRNLKALDNQRDTTMTAGRIALYAKGRVRGKWLLTLAFDTAKRGRTARSGGVIDPGTYYTVYADRSERRYDAQSPFKNVYLGYNVSVTATATLPRHAKPAAAPI